MQVTLGGTGVGGRRMPTSMSPARICSTWVSLGSSLSMHSTPGWRRRNERIRVGSTWCGALGENPMRSRPAWPSRTRRAAALKTPRWPGRCVGRGAAAALLRASASPTGACARTGARPGPARAAGSAWSAQVSREVGGARIQRHRHSPVPPADAAAHWHDRLATNVSRVAVRRFPRNWRPRSSRSSWNC